jgi:ligand-binding sensor domain-containing protein
LTIAGRTFIGTAGRGLWLAGPHPTALTLGDQICSNHVVAVARFRGDVWLGTFDQGLCAFDGQSFRRARVPFRMVNDLVATSTALFVASTRGLFRSTDGVHFQKVAALDGRGITDLAVDGQTLWAVSPAALWRIPLGASGRLRGYFLPGGSHALQAVDAAGGTVWMASEDRGAIRFRHGQFQAFDRAAGLPTSWDVDVAATDDGGAYVATLRHGLVHLDADGRVQPAATQLPDRWLLHVSRDDRGALWVGTQGGAARIEHRSPTTAAAATVAATVDRLPNPCVHAIATIGDDTWFATEGGTAVYRRAQLPVPVGTNERSSVTRSLSSLIPSSR